VVSGCSGGGKSTLIGALEQRGFETMPEAGRLIVQNEQASGGDALPWIDMASFTRKLASQAIDQFHAAEKFDGRVFFDRSLVEALVASRRFGFELPRSVTEAAFQCRYDAPVFLAPPWPEIFENEPERRHSFEDAVSEYEALATTFAKLDYGVCVLPKVSVGARVEFILAKTGT
jgi:predicted ATPase